MHLGSLSKIISKEMAYSSDLTDKEWELIEPLLPKKKEQDLLNGVKEIF